MDHCLVLSDGFRHISALWLNSRNTTISAGQIKPSIVRDKTIGCSLSLVYCDGDMEGLLAANIDKKLQYPLSCAGASLRIRFHLTDRASDFIKSLAQMKFHSPGKYFVKTYIHLFLLFNTNILYSLLLINMKCFLILLNIYNLQIFFCFFYLSLYYW